MSHLNKAVNPVSSHSIAQQTTGSVDVYSGGMLGDGNDSFVETMFFAPARNTLNFQLDMVTGHIISIVHAYMHNVIQEHTESADLRQGESGPDPESISGVRIWMRTPDPDFGFG